MEAYSVLMTIYQKEKPENVAVAIQSMVNQTLKPDEYVIVCDGPLTQQLNELLVLFEQRYPRLFQIVRLPENVGIGAACNVGLRHCKNDLVAKMDADDISVPTRCEHQVKAFAENAELTVVGGDIEEFNQNPDEPFAIRNVPRTNTEIRKFARRRQPFNNVTVMYRRNAVDAVGGYRNLRRCEDYDLYLRLLHAGYYAINLDEVLAKVRVDNSAQRRRASLDTLLGCIRSRWYGVQIGYSSLLDFLICVAGEAFIVLCPGCVQQVIYKLFLRKH